MGDPVAAATLDKLRTHMAEAGLDWLLMGSPANVTYATGYRSVAGDIFPSHQMAVLLGRSELVVVAPASDVGALTEQISLENIEPFGTFYFESAGKAAGIIAIAGRSSSLPEALSLAIRRLGVRGHVGIDDAAERVIAPSELATRNVEGWLRGVRSVKLAAEIERLTTAARLADQAIQAALAIAGSGVTERRLAREVAATMVAGGGMPRFVVVTAGERSALSDARATDRAWQPGELLRFDVGCTVDGYWSDIGRTAVLGEPDPQIAGRYRAIKAGVDAQLQVARPGVDARTLFEVAMEAVDDAGLRPYRRHHCGHGIGLEVYEPPGIVPDTSDSLQPGMVLCLETPFYEVGWGGMMVEDTVVITETGNRILNNSDRDLRVIDP